MSTSILPPLDAEQFRRELAGLSGGSSVAVHSLDNFREHASQLVFALAICFNRDELDAVTLWERIASAIATSCAKVDDGDCDRLISLALEHVKAAHTRVASDEQVAWTIANITEQEETWRMGFIRYLQQHSYTAVIHGRRYWESHKEERKEQRHAKTA